MTESKWQFVDIDDIFSLLVTRRAETVTSNL